MVRTQHESYPLKLLRIQVVVDYRYSAVQQSLA